MAHRWAREWFSSSLLVAGGLAVLVVASSRHRRFLLLVGSHFSFSIARCWARYWFLSSVLVAGIIGGSCFWRVCGWSGHWLAYVLVVAGPYCCGRSLLRVVIVAGLVEDSRHCRFLSLSVACPPHSCHTYLRHRCCCYLSQSSSSSSSSPPSNPSSSLSSSPPKSPVTSPSSSPLSLPPESSVAIFSKGVLNKP